MWGKQYARGVIGLLAVLGATGCVTLPPNHVRNPQDPWESWNRGVYRVNDKLDTAVAKPVARTYVKYVTSPIRTGVSNFFSNLSTPTVMFNDDMHGKFKASLNDLALFFLNSTIGSGGMLAPATPAGL